MIKEELRQLPTQGVLGLCSATAQGEEVLVQIYDIVLSKSKLTCTVSDGNYCVKAFLKDSEITPGNPLTTQEKTSTPSSWSSSTSFRIPPKK